MNKYLLILALSLCVHGQILHPDSLSYEPLEWTIPVGTSYRTEISSVPCFIEKDNALDLFFIQLSFAAGTLLEAPQKRGTAQLHALSLRNGGSAQFSPMQIDSILEQEALTLSVFARSDKTDIILSGLSSGLSTGINILEDLLNSPRFDSARVNYNQTLMMQKLKHRFDTPAPLLSAAWKSVIYPETLISELLPVDAPSHIDTKELETYHQYIRNHAPILAAFAGDISDKQIHSLIKDLFPKSRSVEPRTLPEIIPNPIASTVVIHKEGINQSYVTVGTPSFSRPDKRFYPLSLFNEILGGGGFKSRLVSQLRSDAGLTYSVRSVFETNYNYSATFITSFFTKTESTNHALALTQSIIEATTQETMDSIEIAEKKEQLIQTLPSAFRTAQQRVSTFLMNESYNRPADHYRQYPERLREIPSDSVSLVAQQFFAENPLITVIVADTSALWQSPEWNEFSLQDLFPYIVDAQTFEKDNGLIPRIENSEKE